MRLLLIALVVMFLGNPAFAKTHHHTSHHQHHVYRHYRHHNFYRHVISSAGVIGGRPSGCPYQFCGCGASLYLFHKIIPALNLAANWFRFPRAYPAPHMVAVRQHHVMVLMAPGSRPNTWIVHDSNSGHHRTRVHERSIAGFSIRNPYG